MSRCSPGMACRRSRCGTPRTWRASHPHRRSPFRFRDRHLRHLRCATRAIGDVGHIDLSWFASDLPDAAGYNIYRSETSGETYTKLNSAVIVDTTYADHTALPGVPYFYIYRVVTTDLLEGPDSDEASGTALDTVPPEIVHSAVEPAPARQQLTLLATITDNIAVTGAGVFHRPLGGGEIYVELPMINAVGDQYTVNIPAVDMVSPGVRVLPRGDRRREHHPARHTGLAPPGDGPGRAGDPVGRSDVGHLRRRRRGDPHRLQLRRPAAWCASAARRARR